MVRVRVRLRVRVRFHLLLGSEPFHFLLFSEPFQFLFFSEPFQFLLLSWKRVGMSRKFSVLPDITGKQETHKVDPRLPSLTPEQYEVSITTCELLLSNVFARGDQVESYLDNGVPVDVRDRLLTPVLLDW